MVAYATEASIGHYAMIQFDVTNPPVDVSEPALIDAANEVLKQLYELKVPSILVPDPRTGIRLPGLVRTYIQCHLRRLLMFAEGGLDEYQKGRPLLAFAAARSMYESIAVFYDFTTQFNRLVDTGDIDEARKFLMGRTFATRLPEHLEPDLSNKVVSVVTHVQKLDKKIAQFEETYDRMSEFVHPNAFGSTVHFHKLDGDVATFSDVGNFPTQPLTYLISASFLSSLFLACIAELEIRFRAMSVCVE